jgi:hypothetical protein
MIGCGQNPTNGFGPAPTYHAELLNAVLGHFTTDAKYGPVDGDWPEDYGDANYFGPAFLWRYGEAGSNGTLLALADESLAYDNRLVQEALGDVNVLLTRMEEVLMAGLGLIEGQAYRPDNAQHSRLVDLIDLVTGLAKAYNYYPPQSATQGGFASSTYGPTSINAVLALLNLEAAYAVGGANKQRWIENGQAILAEGRSAAFRPELGYYILSDERPGLFLYPNITQLLAHLRAHQLTGDLSALLHAEALYEAIEPLGFGDLGRYRSPYSAEEMGAKTDDYSTLSSQNYAMLTLALAYSITKKAVYKTRALNILQFVHDKLLEGDRLLHHYMDGRIASWSDKYTYCSGCNLQTLHVIWQMETLLVD